MRREKILVMDDDSGAEVVLSSAMTDSGYELTTAAIGEQGIVIATRGDTCLVFIDLPAT